MRTIAHISDLHFGRVDDRVVEGLLADLEILEPTLLVVSGDFTQRARRGQFAAARAFLDRIASPKILIPGNHDIPFYDFTRRFFSPLGRYQRYITDDLTPFFQDDEIAVLGINTARSLAFQGGRISHVQIDQVKSHFMAVPPDHFKVLVTHHPFIPPPEDSTLALVGRAGLAIHALDDCGVDLLLAGHLHLGYTGDARAYYLPIKRSILVAQAGTATSTRRRGEPNNYNVISIDLPTVTFELRGWDGGKFLPHSVTRYLQVETDWRRVE